MRTNWTPTKNPPAFDRRELHTHSRLTGQKVRLVVLPEHPLIPDIAMDCPLPDEDEGKDCPGYLNCEDCPKALWSIEERSQ